MLSIVATLLLAGSIARAGDSRIFYYGEVLEVNRPKGVFAVAGDDNRRRRFRITSSTQVEQSVDTPVPGTLDDLQVGAYVRVFAGWARSDSKIRDALRILVYRKR